AQQDSAKNLERVEIHTLAVQGNVYMLVGEGGNITVQIGNEGILLVDTQYAVLSSKILASINKLSDRSIRYIVNTQVHTDHTDGNENLRKAGRTILGDIDPAAPQGAELIAQSNVLKRMSAPAGSKPTVPDDALPTSIFNDEKKFYFNGEAIQIIHIP